ncbi:hypothetical protein Acr_03g0007060 [Actinidia rufa]|uniref:Tetratricopeptide repeat (TPR)-like superfamily protein n=1 Tax=Actinidia rufa TaxID=165716 RepID=A0A7J0EC85_9ERIC|nr:hypothetical protein Acr_03g0007060 [Actinidia rufa]
MLTRLCQTLEADENFPDRIRSGFKPRLNVYTVLLRGFLRKGLLRLADKQGYRAFQGQWDAEESNGHCEALEVCEKMQQEGIKPDIRTWNSLITWHCKSGNLVNALELLTRMQEQGLYPDPKIFVSIISCLGEQGNLEIKNNFENM